MSGGGVLAVADADVAWSVVGDGVMSGELVVLGAVTLPGVHRWVRNTRRFLRDMPPPGHPGLDDLVMVGSESVCNAITHTTSGVGGRVTVSLLAGAGIHRLEVADDGAAGERPHVEGEDGTETERGRPSAGDRARETGRGMRTVGALSKRWGVAGGRGPHVVWVEFRFENSFENSDRGLSRGSSTLVPAAFEGEDQ